MRHFLSVLLTMFALYAVPAAAGTDKQCDHMINIVTAVVDSRAAGTPEYVLLKVVRETNNSPGLTALVKKIYEMPPEFLTGVERADMLSTIYNKCIERGAE